MARKKKCPECPPVGAPAWMATYGDMVTLLLTFFVLLLSMATIEQIQFTVAMNSLKGALGVLSTTGTQMPIPRMPMVQIGAVRTEQTVEQQMQAIQEIIQRTQIADDLKMHQSADFLHFTISDNFLFDSGQADLKEGSAEVLGAIAEILKTVRFEVRVEGHTDNVPIHSARFPSNWELSFARALAVSQNFTEHGVDPARFQVIGYGEYRPLADNSSPQGRVLNRRVEVFVNLREEVRRSLIPGE